MKLEKFNMHEGDIIKQAKSVSDEIMDAFVEAGVSYDTAERAIANIKEELQLGEKRALACTRIERATPFYRS